MTRLLCPSMMCANFDHLKADVQALDEAGVDIFHTDVMDGKFVANMAMSPYDIASIKRNTNKLVDVHLMVENPGDVLDIYINLGVDIIYVHPESDKHITRTLGKISAAGIKAGIAINPGTSIETIVELLPIVDYIMVMTVNPGFAGQKFLEFVTLKIQKLAKMKNDYGFQLMVDGAISPQKIEELSNVGVDGFILGTSALFNKNESYEEIIRRLRG